MRCKHKANDKRLTIDSCRMEHCPRVQCFNRRKLNAVYYYNWYVGTCSYKLAETNYRGVQYAMKDFEDAWRNSGPSWGMYIQKCRPQELETLNSKLYKLLMKYGSMFDDFWYYWVSKTGRWLRRTPLWFATDIKNAKARQCFEKHRKYEPNQKITNYTRIEAEGER